MSEIKVKMNEEENRFEVDLNGKKAMIEFILKKENNHIIFTHTEVPPEHSGKGIAATMAERALEYARENKLKVTSLCSYMDSFIQKNPEYQDLLK